MKTTVDLDDKLLAETVRMTDAKTKKEAIHKALMEFIRMKKRQDLKGLEGNFDFGMDQRALENSREDE